MERERCPVCDRYLACDAPEDGLSLTESLCYRGARGFSENKHDTRRQRHCHRHAVNWRSRALAAEARIREAVEVLENDAGMPPVDAGVQPYMDWRYIQRRDVLAILTREPEPTRKPEVTP